MTVAKSERLRLDDQLCFALYAASNEIVRSYRLRLGEIGLTYPQYLVMLVLWQDATSTMQQIADRLMLGQNAITPLINRLREAGFVTRNRNDEDRRIVRIALTDAGRALEKPASEIQHGVACNTGLLEADLAVLREELLTLAQTLRTPSRS